MRSLAIILGVVLSSNAAHARQPAGTKPDDKEAIRQGLAYVETMSLKWLRERKCASCHHVPFMVWAQRDARQRGFAIDEKGLKEASDFLLAADNRANIVPKPDEKEREGNPYSLMALFTTLAFRDGGKGLEPAGQEVMKKAIAHMRAKQDADGSWKRFEGRPPIMAQQESATLFVLHAIGPEPKKDAAPTSRDKAQKWLAERAKGEEQQALSVRILIDHERKASVAELLKRQNADGGWSQTKDMASDAYATGQTMYALLSRGGIDRGDPAIVKARDFLVKTQKPDGSWSMKSRPPNNGKGKDGAKNVEPITVAGSSWAVLGLLQLTPALDVPVSK